MWGLCIDLKYHCHHASACMLFSWQACNLTHLPDFDGSDPGSRNSARDGHGFVETASRDEKVAGSLFVRLHEGTVRHRWLAVAHLNLGCSRCRMQRRRAQVLSLGMELVRELHGLRQHLLPGRLAELAEGRFAVMDQQQIFHGYGLLQHRIVVGEDEYRQWVSADCGLI